MFRPHSGNSFGQGELFNTALRDPAFFERPLEEQAREAGWAIGCPVVERLIDPETGRGADVMLGRYAQINFWFNHIVDKVSEQNSRLYEQLVASVPRNEHEPAGVHDRSSISVAFMFEMAPMTTLPGYALPRLMIAQVGGEDITKDERVDRMSQGLDVLDYAISQSETPEELVAVFADGLTQAGNVAPMIALRSVFARGWYEEHNASTMLENMREAVRGQAPVLWEQYVALSNNEKRLNKIA